MNYDKIKDVEEKRKLIFMGGGQDKLDKQNKNGKNSARERIEMLLDEDSFVEINQFVEHRCVDFGMEKISAASDGVITGFGTINERPVYVYSQDFTVIGGSLGEMHAKKICEIMDMAAKTGAPIIGINDSGGARIQEGLDSLAGFGEIFKRNVLYSGVIPQIYLILGPCAGGSVYSPAIGDFIFMVEDISQMFITGPSVVKAVTGEEISFEGLGGTKTHTEKSGVSAFKYNDEASCFIGVKKLLSFLPSNNLETSEIFESDDINRHSSLLNEIVPDDPNKSYDMNLLIKEVCDYNDFFPIFENYAKNIIVGLARLGGYTVGIVANNPKVMAGVLDANSSEKASRFIRFCDCFNIPLITFTDVPGYMPGSTEEHGGIIRRGAKLIYSFTEASVPKINVIVRKAYGGAYIAMNSRHIGADFVYAWPSAEIAVMGPDGAANIIFRNDINNSEDPISLRKEKIKQYKENFSNPFVAARRGYVNDVIIPEQTRPKLIHILNVFRSKNEIRMKKKHGNIPL